ncbi:NIPSNAP family containing protein [Acrocarpospora pleiomorpha]|uniref:NIPSNAP family containing protein n=1 Tax=Acrocarpospora pleiomorpha TaxID=90975 RepID=A0A5M3XEJ4_9ACTN|nr:NIPSNAP family protein [Acrocarpospora pleiomorpha]GES18579.1 NIPSNAP family containing protein [Acrocarpospora pleiomorpha]
MTGHSVQCPIVELRQYTLHPGQREVLIDLFDREFVETQEAVGITILGQFRDLDDLDRFVWLRGFNDMPGRAQALDRFYTGPVWRAHRAEANATMIDSDDVLLLRPVPGYSGFPAPAIGRPPAGAPAPPSLILATIYQRDRPFDKAFADFFHQRAHPVLAKTGATPMASLQSEHAPNTFPALPVRTGENVFVWFARFADQTHLDDHLRRLDSSHQWQTDVLPDLSATLAAPPQRLRLAPTARSSLR